MGKCGQLIYYDEKSMMCFSVESCKDITPRQELVEHRSLNGNIVYIPTIPDPVELVITGIEKVELDPTTMKRIATYNLETENDALLEEINERQKVIASLEAKEEMLRNRFENAIASFRNIMENGCDDEEDEEFDWDDDTDFI